MTATRAIDYAQSHRSRFLAELKDFVRFPTVSAQPKYAGDLKKCATWLANHLREVGLERVHVVATARHPLVYAASRRLPGRPTVLIYGHYDVQPADPIREWRSPPFEPTVQGQDLVGRGACDDKGQMFTHIKALESYLKTAPSLPANVKCIFEGEEEIGSPNLIPLIEQNKRALAADVAILSDTRMLAPGRPAINYAERGMLSLELEVRGPRHDLHSGNFGGAVHNPLQALCEIIARLHDARRRIDIPGFYRRVRQWSAEERARMRRTGPSDAQIMRDAGASGSWGEGGYSLYERTTLRPALTVNGIKGGYQGPGVKGVIPARATAKISFRLVPDQVPEEVEALVRQRIADITPPTVQSCVRTLSRAKPAVISPRHPAMGAAALAYRKGFGATPVFLRSGGTIPVVSSLQELLGVPTVLMGFALPDDRIHAPNEKLHLPNFYNGIATCIWFLAAIGPKLGYERRVPTEDGAGRDS
jgi:acetylornithine deacetylase/succinyl-diaminopimelate desuccinylase-like protein